MPQFTLHRNYVLRTTKGHTIKFVKGKPTHVPPVIVADAVAIGAVAVNGDVDVLGEEVEAPTPLSSAERKAAVFAAFDSMKARDERMDFTASGLPNAKRMFPLTGFEVTSTERDTYWLEYRANAQDDKDQTILDVRIAEEAEATTVVAP